MCIRDRRVIVPSICVGAALGALTASYIASSTLQVLVAIFLVLISIQMAFEFPPPSQNPKTNVIGPVLVGSGIGWFSGILASVEVYFLYLIFITEDYK